MKARLTKKDRELVRTVLVKWFMAMDCDEDTARRAVMNGSPCMADAVGRRIANGPGYALTHKMTPEMMNAAVVGWLCYKCGLRDEVEPAPVEEDEAPAQDEEPVAQAM